MNQGSWQNFSYVVSSSWFCNHSSSNAKLIPTPSTLSKLLLMNFQRGPSSSRFSWSSAAIDSVNPHWIFFIFILLKMPSGFVPIIQSLTSTKRTVWFCFYWYFTLRFTLPPAASLLSMVQSALLFLEFTWLCLSSGYSQVYTLPKAVFTMLFS